MTATMLLAAYIRERHIDGLSSESLHVSDDDDEFVYSLLCCSLVFGFLVYYSYVDAVSVLSVTDGGRLLDTLDATS